MGTKEIMNKTAPTTIIACLALWGFITLSSRLGAEGLPHHLVCNFTSGTATTFEDGKFTSKSPNPLSFQISKINLDNQTAALITKGRKAPGALKIVRAINANHFIEVVNEGYLNLTTIYDADPKSGEYPAVHSRHLGILGQPIFAQYTGFCSPKK